MPRRQLTAEEQAEVNRIAALLFPGFKPKQIESAKRQKTTRSDSPMLRRISEKHRDVIQSLVDHQGGGMTRDEFFRRTVERKKTEINPRNGDTWHATLLENLQDHDPCTDEEVEAMAVANYYGESLVARGMARRILFGEVGELECALSLATRIRWMEGCQPWRRWDDRYPEIWTVFHGLAARDLDVARAFFGPRPRSLSGGHKPAVLIYNTIQAIVTRNPSAQSRLRKEIRYPNAPDCYRAVLRTLYGIISADPSIVAGELQQILATFRRFQFVEHETIISLIAHGLAELAYWVSPDLIAEFDVQQALPWDSEYYAWLHRPRRSIKYRDVSKYSKLLNRWIDDLEEPAWWYRKQRP